MPDYYCECCDYSTHIITHFKKHLQTNKHKMSINGRYFPEKVINLHSQSYNCKYCSKEFTTKQAMYRHIKVTCKKNKKEDLKELTRLMNEKDGKINELIKTKDKQLEKMQKQIERLVIKLQINNNTTNISKNILNIQILDYNKTDYSHLTDNDYVDCITDCNHCVKTLIEKVHFNETKPENMNIYISSIKGNYATVYKNNLWQIQDRKELLDDLYEYNEILLENWYQDYSKKYPRMIQSFKNYLSNREEIHIINDVKKEILLMLYNNRDVVMKNTTPQNKN